MNAIFEQINSAGYAFVEFALPMLVQSGVLILILLSIELLLRKKVRAVFRYWIWMLVLVKLVLPTSLWSPVSLGRWLGDELAYVEITRTAPAPEAETAPVLPATPPVTDLSRIETDRSAPAVMPATTGIEPTVAVPIGSTAVPAAPLSWQGIVFLVWLSVLTAMALLLLQRAVFVRRLVAQSTAASSAMTRTLALCCRRMGSKGTVGLKVSAGATSPAVCGLFKPVILVPKDLTPNLSSDQLQVVLLHELAHIKRYDLWANLAQTVLQIIYFYNPLLWLANTIIRRAREQAVDEMVLVAMGKKAEQYPQTLVNVAKLAFKRPALSLRLIGVVESKSALAGRIKHILSRPIPKTAKLGLLGLLAVIVVAVVLLPMAAFTPDSPGLVIKGTVKDAQTGKPIAGARVFDDGYGNMPSWDRIRPDERAEWGAITNSAGEYSFLTWAEHHLISAKAPGYLSERETLYDGHFTLDKKDEEIIDFALEPEEVKGAIGEGINSGARSVGHVSTVAPIFAYDVKLNFANPTVRDGSFHSQQSVAFSLSFHSVDSLQTDTLFGRLLIGQTTWPVLLEDERVIIQEGVAGQEVRSETWPAGEPQFEKVITLPLKYGQKEYSCPVRVELTRYQEGNPLGSYWFCAYLSGRLPWGAGGRGFEIVNLDQQMEFRPVGDGTDKRDAVLGIDIDGDGKIDPAETGGEQFDLYEPFKIGSKTYRVAEVDPYLPRVVFHEVGLEQPLSPAPKHDVKAGPAEPARPLVIDPNGNPVAGAQVALCTKDKGVVIRAGRLGPNRMGGRTTTILQTDADGSFDFSNRPDDFHLVAAHEKGFAWLTREQLTSSPEVRLQSWGRIEGRLYIGREYGADKRVSLLYYINKNAIDQGVRYEYETNTDDAGKFVFDKVPPGWLDIGYLTRMGDAFWSQTSRTPVQIYPGVTLRIAIGGRGRPVVGRFVPPPGYDRPVYFGQGLRALDTVRPDRPRPENYDRMNKRQRQEWYNQWYKTPEAEAYYDAMWHDPGRRQYVFRINKDGSFRIEDVIAGKYKLTVWIEERLTGQGRPEEIGAYSGTIEVPQMPGGRSDEPLDLGELELTMNEPVRVGDVAPLFEAKTLDGKDLKLIDYRGKFVLVSFWQPVFHPERQQLRELYDTYLSDGRLEIIGLGGHDTLEEVRKYVEENDFPWPQVFTGEEFKSGIAKEYGIPGIPCIFLVGPDGRIIAKNLRGDKLRSAVLGALGSRTDSKPDPEVDGIRISAKEASLLKTYEVEGFKFEAGFVPDKAEYVWGEPIHYFTYMVRNTGGKTLGFREGGDYRGGRSESHEITAVDANGTPVPAPEMSRMGGIVQAKKLLPGEVYIKMMPVSRRLTFGGPGVYTVTGKRTLILTESLETIFRDETNIKVPTGNSFQLTIHPYSRERMSKVIDGLAAQIRRAGDVVPKSIEYTEPTEMSEANRLYLALSSMIATKEDAALSHLVSMARNDPTTLRITAVKWLGKFTDNRALVIVLEAMDDEDAAIRSAAAEALGAINTDAAIDTLIARLLQAERQVASAILRAMGRTKSPRVFDLLVESLKHEDGKRRRAAVDGLVSFGGNDAVEALKTCVDDDDMDFREFVIKKLAESLKQPIDADWLVPVVLSRKGTSTLGDAPRLMRLYAGPKAVPALLSCLVFENPSTRSYYNYAIIHSQGSCQGGLRIPWTRDLNRDGTPEEIEQNRNILKKIKAWVEHYYAHRLNEKSVPKSQYWQEQRKFWGEPADGISVRVRMDQRVWPEGMPQLIVFDVRDDPGGGSVNLSRAPELLEVQINEDWYVRQPPLAEPTMGIDAGHGSSFNNVLLDEQWQRKSDNRPLALTPGHYTLLLRLSLKPENQRTGPATGKSVQFEVIETD